MRVAESRALLIKPSVPKDRGKKCQLSLVETMHSHRFARPVDSLVHRDFPRRWIFHQRFVKKQEAPVDPRFFRPFLARLTSSPFSPPRSRRRVLLPREMRRHRFKRTRRVLLCQRPNRKSQLLRASSSHRALRLFLPFPYKRFSTARDALAMYIVALPILPLFSIRQARRIIIDLATSHP